MNNTGYCGNVNQGPSNKNKRKETGVASVELDDIDTLSISEKHNRFLAMVMWYLLVFDRLRRFFSNPKDAKLIQWWDSDKNKKGDGKLRHSADAQQWKI